MESTAQIHRPPAGHPLEPYVQAIFRVRHRSPFREETILPKGNVDLLFNLGAPLLGAGLVPEGYLAGEGAAWIGGLKLRPYRVLPAGAVDLVGVSLHADACAPLLPLSPGELVNREAHGLPASTGLEEMAGRLRETPTFAGQCALLMRWLTARLRPLRGADAVRHACALLRRAEPRDAVRTTAKALAVSPRHLRRLMAEHVGVGPAEYVRLARFIDATHRMEVPGRTLTEVAHAAGYHDQAHFCRDFRAFAGMTPQAYRAGARGPVPGHLVVE